MPSESHAPVYREWKVVQRPGAYAYPVMQDGKVVNRLVLFTPDKIKRYAKTTQSMLDDGISIPIIPEHDNKGVPLTRKDLEKKILTESVGFVRGVRVSPSGELELLHEVTDPVWVPKMGTTVMDCSPGFRDWYRTGDGKKWTDVVAHVALTHHPVDHHKPKFTRAGNAASTGTVGGEGGYATYMSLTPAGPNAPHLVPIWEVPFSHALACLKPAGTSFIFRHADGKQRFGTRTAGVNWLRAQYSKQFSLSPDDEGAIWMAVMRAPIGGISIQGKFFRGGQFIPNEVIEAATPQEKAKIQAAKEAHVAKRGTDAKSHMRDAETVHDAILRHAGVHAKIDQHPLDKRDTLRRWSALKAEHGDKGALERVVTLAATEAKKLQDMGEGAESTAMGKYYQRRLSAYAHMVGFSVNPDSVGEYKQGLKEALAGEGGRRSIQEAGSDPSKDKPDTEKAPASEQKAETVRGDDGVDWPKAAVTQDKAGNYFITVPEGKSVKSPVTGGTYRPGQKMPIRRADSFHHAVEGHKLMQKWMKGEGIADNRSAESTEQPNTEQPNTTTQSYPSPHEAIEASPHLSAVKKKAFSDAVKLVESKLSAKAKERLGKNLKGFVFHGDIEDLTAALVERSPDLKNELKGKNAGGAYSKKSGEMFLDGGGRIDGKKVGTDAVYAHEYAHAIDGPELELSKDQGWREAWRAEAQKVSNYATKTPQEGFAEFGRLVFSSGLGTDQLRERYPLSMAHWEKLGLLPDGAQAAEAGKQLAEGNTPQMADVFEAPFHTDDAIGDRPLPRRGHGEDLKGYLTGIGGAGAHDTIRDYAKQLHAVAKQAADEHNSAVSMAMEKLSKHHGKAFTRSHQAFKNDDYNAVNGFDVVASEVANAHPGLFQSTYGADYDHDTDTDNKEKLWDMLKEGKRGNPDIREFEDQAVQEWHDNGRPMPEGYEPEQVGEADTSFDFGANVESADKPAEPEEKHPFTPTPEETKAAWDKFAAKAAQPGSGLTLPQPGTKTKLSDISTNTEQSGMADDDKFAAKAARAGSGLTLPQPGTKTKLSDISTNTEQSGMADDDKFAAKAARAGSGLAIPKAAGQPAQEQPKPAGNWDEIYNPDKVPVVANDEAVSGNWDKWHAGLGDEAKMRRMAAGMKGIEGREYGIREHSPGQFQMVSRKAGEMNKTQPEVNKGSQDIPQDVHDAFNINVVGRLRDQVNKLDDVKNTAGARYAWESATKKGEKPGGAHDGSKSLELWKEIAAENGVDVEKYIKEHPEYNDLVSQLDKHRGWGDEDWDKSDGERTWVKEKVGTAKPTAPAPEPMQVALGDAAEPEEAADTSFDFGEEEKQPEDGQVHTIPAMGNRSELKVKFYPGRHDGEVGIGWDDAHDKPWTYMPADSKKHFLNDLSGKVDLPANSGNSIVDAIASGKGEWLGKGQDGVVFKVGDKVAKMSTTVPYQPMNPGHRSPQEAVEHLEKGVDVNNKLAAMGIPGIMKQELVRHGDKAFAIRDNLEMPDKLTPEQLQGVRQAIDAIHKAGYVVGDEIQVGLKDGKPYLFDLGNAQKARDDQDYEDDSSRFGRFAEKMGGENLPLRRHAEKSLAKHLEHVSKREAAGKKNKFPGLEEYADNLRKGIAASDAAEAKPDYASMTKKQIEKLPADERAKARAEREKAKKENESKKIEESKRLKEKYKVADIHKELADYAESLGLSHDGNNKYVSTGGSRYLTVGAKRDDGSWNNEHTIRISDHGNNEPNFGNGKLVTTSQENGEEGIKRSIEEAKEALRKIAAEKRMKSESAPAPMQVATGEAPAADGFMQQKPAGRYSADDIEELAGQSFTNDKGLTVDLTKDEDGTWSIGSKYGLSAQGAANLLNEMQADKAKGLFSDDVTAQKKPEKRLMPGDKVKYTGRGADPDTEAELRGYHDVNGKKMARVIFRPKDGMPFENSVPADDVKPMAEKLEWAAPSKSKETGGELPGMKDTFAPGMFGAAANQRLESEQQPSDDSPTPFDIATGKTSSSANKWKNNGDGTYTSPNGTIWRKAKAGGEESPVTGKRFAGGSLMPIHGLHEKSEKKPEGEGVSSGQSKPNPNKQRNNPVRQMTAEEIEAEKQRREEQKKWDEIKSGPLNQFLRLGDRPHNIKYKTGGARPFGEFGKQMGAERMGKIVDYLKEKVLKQSSDEIDTDPGSLGSRMGVEPITKEEALKRHQEHLAWQEGNARQVYPKNHVPGTPMADVLLQEHLDGKDDHKKLHDFHTFVQGLGKDTQAADKPAAVPSPMEVATGEAKPAAMPEQPAEQPAAAAKPNLVTHAIHVPKESIFAQGQKRDKFSMHKSISVHALRGANAIWHHQGDPQQTLFNAAQRGAKDYETSTAKEIKAAHDAGYRFHNYRAGKYGTLWVLEKDGNILTERGAKALVDGTGKVTFGEQNGREHVKPIIDELHRFISQLPETTKGNLGALTQAINRSPLGEHISLNRSPNGELRLSDKAGKHWHISEPTAGHDASGTWHRQLDSSLPRFLDKIEHMASNDMGDHWTSHDRAADAYAVAKSMPAAASTPAAPPASAPEPDAQQSPQQLPEGITHGLNTGGGKASSVYMVHSPHPRIYGNKMFDEREHGSKEAALEAAKKYQQEHLEDIGHDKYAKKMGAEWIQKMRREWNNLPEEEQDRYRGVIHYGYEKEQGRAKPAAPQQTPAPSPMEVATGEKQDQEPKLRRARTPIHFDLAGPSGAKLHTYDWQFKWETDPLGEDERRVSDWDRAETNAHTGKNIVHQFNVSDANGQNHTVSLETAIKMLGYGDGVEGAAKVKNLAQAAMQLAEQRKAHDELVNNEDDKKKLGHQYRVENSQGKIDYLQDRVEKLTNEARMHAEGKNPTEHYRSTFAQAKKLRDMFHTRPQTGEVTNSGHEISAIAKAAGKGREEQQSTYDAGLAAYKDLMRASRHNLLGERYDKTPIHEEIPESNYYGKKIPAVPAWSDAKMRNWYFDHGEDAHKAIETAQLWFDKYGPKQKEETKAAAEPAEWKEGHAESASDALARVQASPNQPNDRDWERYASTFGMEDGKFHHVEIPTEQLAKNLESGHLRRSNSVNPKTVDEKVQSGDRNPVVITHEPGKGSLVVDGNHSLQAAIKGGDKTVKAIVSEKSPFAPKQEESKGVEPSKATGADKAAVDANDYIAKPHALTPGKTSYFAKDRDGDIVRQAFETPEEAAKETKRQREMPVSTSQPAAEPKPQPSGPYGLTHAMGALDAMRVSGWHADQAASISEAMTRQMAQVVAPRRKLDIAMRMIHGEPPAVQQALLDHLEKESPEAYQYGQFNPESIGLSVRDVFKNHADKQGKMVGEEPPPAPMDVATGEAANEESPSQQFSPEHFTTIAANSIGELRGQDVYRLMDSAPPEHMETMANYILKNRPDLSGEIHDARNDIHEERGTTPTQQPAATAPEPVPSPLAVATGGTESETPASPSETPVAPSETPAALPGMADAAGPEKLKLKNIVRTEKNVRSMKDRRAMVTRTVAEFTDSEGNVYRKSFEAKGKDPVIPESGTHEELNKKHQFQFGGEKQGTIPFAPWEKKPAEIAPDVNLSVGDQEDVATGELFKASEAVESGAKHASATPRDVASAVTRALDPSYAFARSSSVGNAGEDLIMSKRHLANAWRGLEQAEADGIAEKLVNRDRLAENEPHKLMTHADENPLTALAMHFALKHFPAEPGYKKTRYGRALGRTDAETAKTNREHYVQAYRSIKAEAERLAQSESDPRKALSGLADHVGKVIRALRGQVSHDSIKTTTGVGLYNETANALTVMPKKLRDGVSWGAEQSTSPMGKMMEFTKLASDTHGKVPTEGTLEERQAYYRKLARHAKNVIEGQSLPRAFGVSVTGEKKDSKPKITPADMYVEVAERTGGRDTPEGQSFLKKHLLETVGLRGIQFGNYVSDDERIHHLKKAAEAFVDLADVTGLPDNAASLKGAIGLAFGARGNAGALAHYEPDTKVINLTRKSGVGSLAHEWGHALDHFLAGGGKTETKQTALHGMLSDDRYSNKKDDPVWAGMDAVRQAWKDSGYQARLSTALKRHVDKGLMSDKKADQYWDSRSEKFARTFEQWVQHELLARGQKNTYLAGFNHKEYDGPAPEGHELWPTREEITKMAPAFRALLHAVREKHFSQHDMSLAAASRAQRVRRMMRMLSPMEVAMMT